MSRWSRHSDRSWGGFAPYVRKEEREANAAKKVRDLQKKGMEVFPVRAAGRTIAESCWGTAWCRNLEIYSDFANRLPRGRTYLRNGSVIHLEVCEGSVQALVNGSSIYSVKVHIRPLVPERWNSLRGKCSSAVSSVVELLQGRLSEGVMSIMTAPESGLFPSPKEISFECSCPDSAYMCKHVAAVLYGIGVRFDSDPAVFFKLRGVDPSELVNTAACDLVAAVSGEDEKSSSELGKLFGIDIDEGAVEPQDVSKEKPAVTPLRLVKSVGRSKPVRKTKSTSKAKTTRAAKESLAKNERKVFNTDKKKMVAKSDKKTSTKSGGDTNKRAKRI